MNIENVAEKDLIKSSSVCRLEWPHQTASHGCSPCAMLCVTG